MLDELGGGCGVESSAYAEVFDFFWEDGDLGFWLWVHGWLLSFFVLFWLCRWCLYLLLFFVL